MSAKSAKAKTKAKPKKKPGSKQSRNKQNQSASSQAHDDVRIRSTNQVTCVWDPYSEEWCMGMDDCMENYGFDCSLLDDPDPKEEYTSEEVTCIEQRLLVVEDENKKRIDSDIQCFLDCEKVLVDNVSMLKDAFERVNHDHAREIVRRAGMLIEKDTPRTRRNFARLVDKMHRRWGDTGVDNPTLKDYLGTATIAILRVRLKFSGDETACGTMGCERNPVGDEISK